MDEVRLSPHEQRILAELEESLGRDRALARRLRAMRRGLLRRLLMSVGVAVALAGSVALLALATATGRPGFVWAFAGAWLLSLTGLTVLVVGWCHRWSAAQQGGA
ncbi:DUF3040 domain-containing protein [Streptomyces sp. NPDC053493]|uniref:DUF3040 domain-containing protein n=1 Tax=Streptomyces sp. NPDC053493 TaxID=3365705 RepID=UPI0037D55E8B